MLNVHLIQNFGSFIFSIRSYLSPIMKFGQFMGQCWTLGSSSFLAPQCFTGDAKGGKLQLFWLKSCQTKMVNHTGVKLVLLVLKYQPWLGSCFWECSISCDTNSKKNSPKLPNRCNLQVIYIYMLGPADYEP